MTPNPYAGILGPRTRPASAASTRLLPWLALAALFVVAVALRHLLAANTDVSWLLTVGERVLSGHRLYVDVIETNPPMAVFAYLPGILLARALGMTAETAVDVLVFIGIAATLALCARILTRAAAIAQGQGWPMALLAFAVLAILPMQTFGQRDHIALLALLPMLAVMAARMRNHVPGLTDLLLAGLGAAIALSFKPHFALALCSAMIVTAVATRASLRVLLSPEYLSTAIALVAYAAVTFVLFPEYMTVIVPLVRDVYIPIRLPLSEMLKSPAVWLWLVAVLGAVLLKRRTGIDRPFVLLLVTSSGFVLVFILQRKGWAYHSYPMLALAWLGLGHAVISRLMAPRPDRLLGIGGGMLLAALFLRAMVWFEVAFDAQRLQQAVARLGPHPVILAISGEPGIGHPLVRALGGTWVSRQQALWVATYLKMMQDRGSVDPALGVYEAREREMLVADIRRTPPTVVLVDDPAGADSAWLKTHPDVGGLLQNFWHVDTIDNVAILALRD